MGKGSWIFKIPFLQPIGTWKTQRMTKNRPYPLHFRRDAMLGARKSTCKQQCSCWYYALNTFHTWDLTNTISHVWQQEIDKANLAFRLFSNTLGNEFLETQLSQQELSDSRWARCRPTAIIFLSISPVSEALKSNGLGFRWFQEPSDILDC